MFDLGTEWWEILLRTTVVYAALVAGFRIPGKRQIGQMAAFDLAVILPTVLGLLGYTLLGTAMSTLAVRKHTFWTLTSLKPEIAV